MAVAVYTTDLVDISTAESATGWAEPGTWAAGAAPAQDAENFIQGSFANSKGFNATSIGGMGFTIANTPMTTPASVFFWHYWASPQTLDTETNGGIRAMVGSSTAAFYGWKVGGINTYNYGGWINYAVDPSVTPDYTVGSPTTTKAFFGMVINNLNAVSKGSPFLCDAIRYGRTLQVVSGDGSAAPGSYGNFASAAAKNDANDGTNGFNRWGLFQAIDGGYLMKGLFLMGTAGTATDFRDSNRVISIQNTKKVASGFNAFEVRNASSNISWSNINISALGTVSRGDFIATNNATIAITTCVFTDMGTFGFLSASTITTSTFRRCNLVTQSTAVFTGCIFDSTNDAAKALLCNDPSKLTTNQFISSGTKHGIEFNTPGTSTFAGNTFTGYAGSDGTSGNEGVYNNCTPYNTTQTYASSNQDSTLSMRSDAGGTSATGESFQSTATKVLSVARFYLKKTGLPSGNATAKIYAVTGTPNTNSTPTGAALATSETFSVASLTGSFAMTSFLFKNTNCISLTSGTNYFVVLDISATTSSSGNTIDVGYDNSSPSFTAGNAATYAVTGGTWSSQAYDLVFDCYTDGAVILNVTSGGSTPSIRNALGCSTTINNNITVTITVIDQSGIPIPGVEVSIFQDVAARTVVLASTPTDGSGVVSTSAAASTGAIIIRARQSTTKANFNSGSGINAGTEVITTSTDHNFRDGDAIVYSKNGGTAVTNLTNGSTYYVNNLTATTLSLHTSAANAIADTSRIDLASAGSETHTLDPIRYVANSATGTIGTENFSAQITMITDTIATG